MKIISGLWTKKGSSETTLGFGPKKRQKAPSNAPDERALTSTVPSHKVIRMAHGTAAYTYAYGFGGHDAKQCQANGADFLVLHRGSDDCGFRIELYMLPPLFR